MRLALRLHPESKCSAVGRIEVEALRPSAFELVLRFEVIGDMERVKLPPPSFPKRADDLWRTTCFEAFVRPPAWAAYYELNFSPSTRWAAYRFKAYREEMTVAQEIDAPQLASRRRTDAYELDADVSLAETSFPGDGPWHLALSAVIEETDGIKSYWAWAHAAGKPDFHHPDAFACELAPP